MAKNIAVDQDMTLRRKWLLKKFIRYYRKKSINGSKSQIFSRSLISQFGFKMGL